MVNGIVAPPCVKLLIGISPAVYLFRDFAIRYVPIAMYLFQESLSQLSSIARDMYMYTSSDSRFRQAELKRYMACNPFTDFYLS